jgi:hypothetical protein
MSVEELADHIREAGLARIAMLLEEHKVDGDFFKVLKASEFNGPPFSTSAFELEALKRIQKGKLPKKR